MKIAVLFALCAPVIFAIQAVTVKRVAHVTPFIVILGHGIVLLCAVLGIVAMRMAEAKLTWPKNGGEWGLIAIQACLIFAGLFCILSCYRNGGSVLLVTTAMSLVPLFSGIVRHLTGQGRFSLMQLFACIGLAVMVFLILREERLE